MLNQLRRNWEGCTLDGVYKLRRRLKNNSVLVSYLWSSILSGWLILFPFLRRTTRLGFVSILGILTRPVLRMIFPFHTLICWLIALQGILCYHLWMGFLGIIRFWWLHRIWRRHLSSLSEVLIAIGSCHLGWRTQEPLIREPLLICSMTWCTKMLRYTWMTW